MKKKLLLFAALLGLSAPCFATDILTDYLGQEALDGKDIRIHTSKTISDGVLTKWYINVNEAGTGLLTSTGHSDNSLWHAEYDADEDGFTLCNNGKYIGAVPATTGASTPYSVTATKADAGRFRFYYYDDAREDYVIAATRFTNGSAVQGYVYGPGAPSSDGSDNGFVANQSNIWMKKQPENTIIRFGSLAGESKWAYEIVEPEIVDPVVTDYIEIELNEANGSFTATGSFSNTYETDGSDGVRLESHKSGGNLAANMSFSNGNLKMYSGNPAPATYKFIPKNSNYYVAEVSFDAQAASGTQTITFPGETAVTLSTTEPIHFVGEPSMFGDVCFVLGGANVGTVFTNFKVKLREKKEGGASGWYQIHAISLDGTACDKYAASANAEYRQSASSFYSFKYITEIPEANPAITYIYFDHVGDNAIRTYSQNGHGVNYNGTATLSTPSDLSFTLRNRETNEYTVSGSWSQYEPDGDNEKPYLGQMTGKTNIVRLNPVDPTENYDLWTVNILGETNASELKDNLQVTLHHGENKGLASVYNNGTFFVTKGTELSFTDFSVSSNSANANAHPLITADNESHTVTVDLSKYMIPVSAQTGTGNQGGWFQTWTSSAAAGVPNGGTLTLHVSANNMSYINNRLVIACGRSGSCDYKFDLSDNNHYISGYYFEVRDTVAAAGATSLSTITPVGGEAVTVTADAKAVVNVDCAYGADAQFHMTTPNHADPTYNFYVFVEAVTDEIIENYISSTINPVMIDVDELDVFSALWEVDPVKETMQNGYDENLQNYRNREIACTAALANITAISNGFSTYLGNATPKDGTMIQIGNAFSGSNLGKFVAENLSNNKATSNMADGHSMTTMWTLIANPEDPQQFILENYATKHQLINTTTNETILEVGENGSYYKFEPARITDGGVKKFCIGIRDVETVSGQHYLHGPNNGTRDRLIKWGQPTVSGNPGSGWFITLAEAEDVVSELEIGMEQVFNETGTGYVHKLTFASAATHSGVTYADHHNIHIWQIEIDETADDEDEQPEEGGDMNGVRARVASARSYHRVGDESLHNLSLNNAEVDDSGVSFTLNSVLPAGDYEVALPSAVLLADGKHNKAATATFRVDNNGAVTGIHEVAVTPVAMPGADVIYDLQGRRLSKPMHGINIINGRKVLVK